MEAGGAHLLPVLPDPSTRGQLGRGLERRPPGRAGGVLPGGGGGGCWFPEAPKPAASGPPPHPAPSHRWGDEDKPERGKHQVKPGELEKWRRNGEGKIQSPLDSTPRVLFGQPN